MSEEPEPIWIDADDLAWLERKSAEAGIEPGRFAGQVIHAARLADEARGDPWAEALAENRRRRQGRDTTT